MSEGHLDAASLRPERQSTVLFLRRWLANPLQMGSIIPSSPALGRQVARLIERHEDEVVLELGAGTGAITRALLAGGGTQGLDAAQFPAGQRLAIPPARLTWRGGRAACRVVRMPRSPHASCKLHARPRAGAVSPPLSATRRRFA